MTAAFYPVKNPTTADSDGYFAIPGNFTGMFTPGFDFVVVDSGGSPITLYGAYNFTVSVSSFDGANTNITPTGSPPISAPTGSYVSLVGGGYQLDSCNSSTSSIIIAPGSADSSTSLIFPGRAYLNYGQLINQDLFGLLENFACDTAPASPIEGQLWWDISDPDLKVLKIWDGSSWIATDFLASSFWRDPVRIHDPTSYADLTAAATALCADLTPQGITTPLADGDRVLLSDINSKGPDSDIYVLRTNPSGPPCFTLEDDHNRIPAQKEYGDATYITEGLYQHTVYFYRSDDEWAPLAGGGEFWRDPVRIVDTTAYANLTAAANGICADLSPQGISTPLADGDRVLLTDINSYGPDSDIYILRDNPSAPPCFTLEEDDNRFPAQATRGDATYAIEGNSAHLIYFYTENDKWETFSGAGGGGTSVGIDYEAQVASGSDTFNLLTISYILSAQGKYLQVFVNGVKQTVEGASPDHSYSELTTTSIQFEPGYVPTAGDVVEFYSYTPNITGLVLGALFDVDDNASAIGSPPTVPGTGYVLTFNGVEWVAAAPSVTPATDYHEFIASGGESIIATGTVNVTSSPGSGTAYQQVFLNGILLREGAAAGYTVTGAAQITIHAPYAPLSLNDEVLIYEL